MDKNNDDNNSDNGDYNVIHLIDKKRETGRKTDSMKRKIVSIEKEIEMVEEGVRENVI